MRLPQTLSVIIGLATALSFTEVRADERLAGTLERVAGQVLNFIAGKGQSSIALGRFVAPFNPEVQHEPRIREILEARLKGKIVPGSALILSGEYKVKVDEAKLTKPATARENVPVEIEFQFSVANRNGKVEDKFVDRVTNPLDIARICGLTDDFSEGADPKRMAIKVAATLAQRQNANGIVSPRFHYATGSKSRVKAAAKSEYAVEILKKNAEARLVPVEIESRNGDAYVNIGVGDVFVVRIASELGNAVLAKVFIDGLDTINAYNEDHQKYGGYVIGGRDDGKMSHGNVRGFLRTADSRQNNIFEFLVATSDREKLRQHAVNSPNAILGVISVEFYEQELVSRSVDNSKQVVPGQLIDGDVKKVDFFPKNNPAAIISIRYDTPRGAN